MSKRILSIINSFVVIIGLTSFIAIYLITNDKALAFPFLIATQIIDLILGFIIGDR